VAFNTAIDNSDAGIYLHGIYTVITPELKLAAVNASETDMGIDAKTPSYI
jgi:hypothetical protein|tara:strand:- start:1797 stop:1946 length:150 start_codon:yes stop_codon:yes gene_type:complete